MLRNFSTLCRATVETTRSDGQLLETYVGSPDGAAFAELVRRHGPMVWGVCRRLLASREDAEDAFQATFLVLVRKPDSVRPAERVGNWLHGVAVRVAQKAAKAVSRRRERQVECLPEPATVAEEIWHELLPILDQEITRLPEKYRLAVVLCDLEGNTRREAAARLGWPEGTVAGRLALGRAMLARRLVRQGLCVSGGTLTATVSSQQLNAAVPFNLFNSTVRMATGGAGGAVATTLSEGVIRAMTASKLATFAVVALGLVIGGVAFWAQPNNPPSNSQPPLAVKPDETNAKREISPDRLLAQGAMQPDRVGRIVIEGNSEIPDELILWNLGLQPGEILTYDNVDGTRRRLLQTRLFDRSDPPTVEVSPNEFGGVFVDIRLRVKVRPWNWTTFVIHEALPAVLTLNVDVLWTAAYRLGLKLASDAP